MNNSLDILFLPAQDVRPKVSSLFLGGEAVLVRSPSPSLRPQKKEKEFAPREKYDRLTQQFKKPHAFLRFFAVYAPHTVTQSSVLVDTRVEGRGKKESFHNDDLARLRS